jgi:hypothetical protein
VDSRAAEDGQREHGNALLAVDDLMNEKLQIVGTDTFPFHVSLSSNGP